MSEMGKQRRRFSPDFKAEVVRLVLSGQRSVPEVCRQHDLYTSSVYGWVRQAKIDGGQGSVGAVSSAELEELRALRKKTRELEKENRFLKEAAAYFAKETK